MPEIANVVSIRSLRDFAAALAVFNEHVQNALGTATMEVQRAQLWLEEQLRFWEKNRRDRDDEVSQARIALEKKKMFKLGDRPPDCTEEEEAYDLAQRRLEEAYDRIANCKRWRVSYTRAAEEFEAPVRRLQGFIEADLERGKALLGRMSEALEAYVDMAPISREPPASAALPPSETP
jgi:hypothetical protein